MSDTYQWRRCDAFGASCVDIPGETSDTYVLASADVGHTIRVFATDGGVLSDTSAATPPITATADPAGFDALTAALTYPAVTVTRHVICTTRAQHDAAVAALLPGDWVDCRGITFTGEVVYAKKLTSWAKITYDQDCVFAGAASGSHLPAIWLRSVAYIQFIGGAWPTVEGANAKIKNGAGLVAAGMSWADVNHCVIDGFIFDNCGTSGIAMIPTNADCANNFVRIEVKNSLWDKAEDDHPEKGTGLHCGLLGDTNLHRAHDNTVVIYGHDCVYGGSVIEVGDDSGATTPYNNEIYIKAYNMQMVALSQVGGNAVNLWGSSTMHDNEFVVVEASKMQGRAVDANGGYSGSWTNVKVTSGHAENCCLNPHLGSTEPNPPGPTNPWDARHGVIYGTVTTSP